MATVATDFTSALAIAERIGFPIALRPSFTIRPARFEVADKVDLEGKINAAVALSPIGEVLVERGAA
jgi:carbamoylphosphate synthase large subunit